MGMSMGISILDQIIRIFVAIAVGGIIGLERKRLHKAAGVRTHAVITVTCTMLTIVSVYGFNGFSGNIDPTRLLSNIITGVGFLAGGVIYVTTKKDNKSLEENVVGLTTAAGIFGAAMLGIPIGLGHFDLVLITIVGIEISLQTEKVLITAHLIKNDKIYNGLEPDKNKDETED
jgi:putative Mg2+ transporter-C (MgtC) family protein